MINMKIKIFLLFFLLIRFMINLHADNTRVSTTGADILTVTMEPRAFGMADAYTAVDDIHSLIYNPAGIGIFNQFASAIMYRKGIMDINYGAAAIVYPISENHALGINFGFLSQGGFDFYSESGTIESTALGNTYRIGLSYGYAVINKTLSLGATTKYISSNLTEEYSASTVAFDLGILCHLLKQDKHDRQLSLGLAVKNLGSGLKFLNEEDPLPQIYALGIAYDYHFQYAANPFYLLVSTDLVKARQYDGLPVNTGVELDFRHTLMLRLGYQFKNGFSLQDNNGFSTGLGVQYKGMQFDYAFKLSSSELSPNSHCFSLTYRFSSAKNESPAKDFSIKKAASVNNTDIQQTPNSLPAETIKYEDITHYHHKIINLTTKADLASQGWVMQYSTNKLPDQSKESMDYITGQPEKGKAKWVRWMKKDEKNKKDDPIYYKISLE